MFTELCDQTRGEVFDMMLQHAAEAGANAVVGVRCDATEVMDGVTEVLGHGTAVPVEPGGAVGAGGAPARAGNAAPQAQ